MKQNKPALSHPAAPDSLSAQARPLVQEQGESNRSELPARLSSLHARILNIPCVYPANVVQGDEWAVYCFKRGHKEARHAAAELALVADDLLAALHEVLRETCDVTVSSFIRSDRAYAIARAAINRATS